nr:hypothetical protein [Stappia sp. ES.058]
MYRLRRSAQSTALSHPQGQGVQVVFAQAQPGERQNDRVLKDQMASGMTDESDHTLALVRGQAFPAGLQPRERCHDGRRLYIATPVVTCEAVDGLPDLIRRIASTPEQRKQILFLIFQVKRKFFPQEPENMGHRTALRRFGGGDPFEHGADFPFAQVILVKEGQRIAQQAPIGWSHAIAPPPLVCIAAHGFPLPFG